VCTDRTSTSSRFHFEGQFDLIVAKHMFARVHPRDFLATIRDSFVQVAICTCIPNSSKAEVSRRDAFDVQHDEPFTCDVHTAAAVRGSKPTGSAWCFCTMSTATWPASRRGSTDVPSDWTRMLNRSGSEGSTSTDRVRPGGLQVPNRSADVVAAEWDGPSTVLVHAIPSNPQNGRIKVRPRNEAKIP